MANATLPNLATTRVMGALDALLRSEFAAVETYQQAIGSLGGEAGSELFDCLNSHQFRAEFLSERIADLHGVPSVSAAPWATFASLRSGSAREPSGRQAILTALRDGEARNLEVYHEGMNRLDMASLRLLEVDLLPEQHRTVRVMNSALTACAAAGGDADDR